MAELPTKAELEQLYHDKGHDALVWYTWRNALRVLPLLGRLPLREIWLKNTVQHVYAVCRSDLVLAQWANDPKVVHDASPKPPPPQLPYKASDNNK